jgi:hypothetical protein
MYCAAATRFVGYGKPVSTKHRVQGMLIIDNARREERGCLAALEIRITWRPDKIQIF